MIILTITHFAELLLDHSRQLFLYFSFFNTADSKLNLVENHSIIFTRKGRIEIVDLWTAQCPILNSLRNCFLSIPSNFSKILHIRFRKTFRGQILQKLFLTKFCLSLSRKFRVQFGVFYLPMNLLCRI